MLHILPGHAPQSKHHHDTIAQARDCEADEREMEQLWQIEIAAEQAWLVHAENAGWAEAELQRQMDDLFAPFDPQR